MKWVKQDAYSIKNGEWWIAKYYTPFGIKYGLSNGNAQHGYFTTSDEAKAKHKELTA
jgi:hypothetical protein